MKTQQKGINIERLKSRIVQMASIGQTDNGGITRLALSKEDKVARELLIQWMQDIGLQTRYDDIGNIYGRLEGSDKKKPAVLTGSHIDTVPKGGKFDGTLGLLAALEVIESIIEQNIVPTHPLEIVAFTNEEGARFTPQMLGSGVIANEFSKEFVYERKDLNGYLFKNELQEIGFLGLESNRAKNIKAFLEFHIEQGPILEAENIPVGIVDGVSGFSWMEVIINGQSNHSGTTPMHMREDSLVTAATIVKEIHEYAKGKNDGTVLTVGRIQAIPGIINAVPGQTIFSIDVRHAELEKLESIIDEIKTIVKKRVAEANLSYIIEDIWLKHPVKFSSTLVHTLEKICETHEIPYKHIVSGAGHDAMYMNNITDTAMIFVPSIAGKSHCKEEDTSWKDIEKGVTVLYDALCHLSVNP
ncbi:Zn-dependent hydrolase [Bacillus sp. FJAT-29790]|uniref:Zn-dependent hydrolase n=1 Tax=Bacillus sp. FJAT-29790 TaxID=1895002 RepID=UPI001C247370|nr:Zn-dependent hydrolase [Bacillus sp. FJAT-29790]MBU8878600.1 Zn-dependent hydrolase [Bacillus sp. FJAT-29790]